MPKSSAAVSVWPHYPTDDEIEELTYYHLDQFDVDYATATVNVTREAPEFMSTCERDQINAHVRDGGRKCHVIVIYMQETEGEDIDEDEYDEEDSED